jgi:hypothetical protein
MQSPSFVPTNKGDCFDYQLFVKIQTTAKSIVESKSALKKELTFF